MNDAFFARKIFTSGEQNGYRFFMWGESQLPFGEKGEMASTSTYAEPADGAFLCELKTGWLFVTGVGANNNFRHTFFDDSPDAATNARAMESLGIPILPVEDANHRVKADGVTLFSITGDEKRRAMALARTTRKRRALSALSQKGDELHGE